MGKVRVIHHRGHPTKATTPLANLIRARGYTVPFVAEGVGIDMTTMADYVNGRPIRSRATDGATSKHGTTHNAISTRHLVRLSAFLKCEPEDIQHT